MTHYLQIKNQFNLSNEKGQRGDISKTGLIKYAEHVLYRLNPETNAKLLDVGCGDGILMNMILQIRPDLTIHGVEISDVLANKARKRNLKSIIFNGNAINIILPDNDYDAIYSFSVLQYFKSNSVPLLNDHLSSFMRNSQTSKIVHCSVPNSKLRAVQIAEVEFRNNGLSAWWRTPFHFLYELILYGDRYAENSYWHNPVILEKYKGGAVSILSSDSWYRFDMYIAMKSET